MRRASLIALALAATLAAPRRARAQADLPERRVHVRWVEGVPRVRFSAVDLADAAMRETLEGGLWQTLVMRVYAYRGADEPVAATARTCRVRYDPWARTYEVEVRWASGERDETLASISEVLRRCLAVEGLPVGRAEDYLPLRDGRVRFAVHIELNPLSPETLQRLRRWLSRPAGGGRPGGRAFFGSFVSLFVNRRIGAAERTLRFRSQPVRVRP